MKSTDHAAFAATLASVLSVYDKAVSPTLINIWIASLKPYELTDVQAAFERHLTNPETGRFAPKPADIIQCLNALQSGEGDSGHPGPEQAWGMLIRFINDERETGLYTEEMREGWTACTPILQMGDEVGARMCFLETYRKALQRALEARKPPKWSLTIGSDVERRKTALKAAVDAGRLSSDYAAMLLPLPAPEKAVFGLLETDTAPSTVRTERWRRLAAQLRQSMKNEGDSPAMQAEQERIRRISARQGQIDAVLQDRARYATA